jgi:hypothetical protein
MTDVSCSLVPGGGTTGVAGVVVKPGLFVLPVVVLRICGGVVDPSDGVVKSSAVDRRVLGICCGWLRRRCLLPARAGRRHHGRRRRRGEAGPVRPAGRGPADLRRRGRPLRRRREILRRSTSPSESPMIRIQMQMSPDRWCRAEAPRASPASW